MHDVDRHLGTEIASLTSDNDSLLCPLQYLHHAIDD